MRTVYTFTESHLHQLHKLYQQEWWSKKRTLEETRLVVAGSQVCIGLVNGDDLLIGFTRVVTDFAFKALIFDVIVAESERGKNLGAHLMNLVKSHEKLRGVRHFELYCLPDMCAFYKQYGFHNLEDVRLMRWVGGT